MDTKASAVELVATGSELLNGRTLNRHAKVLGEHLRRIGLSLERETTVPDDMEVIESAVAEALNRVDVVVVTGGLGPTSDDVTRDAVARLLKRRVVMDEPSLTAVRERYQRLGREIKPPGEKQALIVEGAVALSNAVGMAPGERIDAGEKTLFVLPGPPGEFLSVLEEHVLPWLREKFAGSARRDERIFMTCGIGESDIAARIEAAGMPLPGVEIAYCAAPGRTEVRLARRGDDRSALDESASRVRDLLGDAVYAEERLELEAVVGRLLGQKRATLATAESCTGGLLGYRITSVAGSSQYYLGGVIAYSNDVKVSELGVKNRAIEQFGAVSEEVARQMAVGVRGMLGSDYGLSITGVAGPAGGSPEKPVGLVYIGLADESRVWVREFRLGGDRQRVRETASRMALDVLRRCLTGCLPSA